MAKRKRKVKPNDTFGVVRDFVDLVDTTFERLTGKPIAEWLKQFGQQPQLPCGEPAAPQQDSAMSLADAYAALGLPPTASPEEVTRNYRRLAAIFHPDHQGGYDDAMKLLNQAWERIAEGKGR